MVQAMVVGEDSEAMRRLEAQWCGSKIRRVIEARDTVQARVNRFMKEAAGRGADGVTIVRKRFRVDKE